VEKKIYGVETKLCLYLHEYTLTVQLFCAQKRGHANAFVIALSLWATSSLLQKKACSG